MNLYRFADLCLMLLAAPSAAAGLRLGEAGALQPDAQSKGDHPQQAGMFFDSFHKIYRLVFGPVEDIQGIFWPVPETPKAPPLQPIGAPLTLAEEVSRIFSDRTTPRIKIVPESKKFELFPKPNNAKEFVLEFFRTRNAIPWTENCMFLNRQNRTGFFLNPFGRERFTYDVVAPGTEDYNKSTPMTDLSMRFLSRRAVYSQPDWLNLGYLILVASMWLVFALQCSWGVITGRGKARTSPGIVSSFYLGCLYRLTAKSSFEALPRVVTSAFLHANFLHIFANSACVLQACIFWMHGNTRNVVWFPWFVFPLWLGAAAAGGIASYIVELQSEDDLQRDANKPVFLVGASGGAVGLQAAVMVLALFLEGLPTVERRMAMFFSLMLTAMLSAFPLGSHEGVKVSVTAHIGGMAAGAVLAILLLMCRRVLIVLRVVQGMKAVGKGALGVSVGVTLLCWLAVALQGIFMGKKWASSSLAYWIGIRSDRELGETPRAATVAPLITSEDDRLNAELKRKWKQHYQYDSEAPLLRRVTLTFTERDFPDVYSILEKAEPKLSRRRGTSWRPGQQAVEALLATSPSEEPPRRAVEDKRNRPATVVPFQRISVEYPASMDEEGGLASAMRNAPAEVSVEASPLSVEFKSVYTSLLLRPFLPKTEAGPDDSRLRHSWSALNFASTEFRGADRQFSAPP